MVAAFALILHELLLIVLGMGGWSVGFCMAAGIDAICLMRQRTGNQIGTALREASGRSNGVRKEKDQKTIWRGQSRQYRRDNG